MKNLFIKSFQNASKSFSSGFSLMEIALLSILVSIALLPLVAKMGQEDPTTSVRGQSKMTVQANSLLEKALANGVIYKDNSGSKVNFESDLAGGSYETPVLNIVDGGSGASPVLDQKVCYKWRLKNLTNRVDQNGTMTGSRALPNGNTQVQANLEIYQCDKAEHKLYFTTYSFSNTASVPVTGSTDLEVFQSLKSRYNTQ